MKIAVVGATGLVGRKMLQVINELHLDVDMLIPVASERSYGKTVQFASKEIKVVSVEQALMLKPDIAIFSAGSDVSLAYAPQFAALGTYVIDNSSAWRMNSDVPLVVPEINCNTITANTRIIANPNCSTIGMVMAVAPLHKQYGVKRLVISTYQSVSGSGMKGLQQLDSEEHGLRAAHPAYPHQIYRNVLPHGGNFCDNAYTTEEEKLVNETRKILNAPQIAITATVARVPVVGGHSESVNIEFEHQFELDDVKLILASTPGVEVQDNPEANLYPMAITSYDRDEVFVGRIRRDFSIEKGLNLWVVSDNLRKGAATNAVQIAQYVMKYFIGQ